MERYRNYGEEHQDASEQGSSKVPSLAPSLSFDVPRRVLKYGD